MIVSRSMDYILKTLSVYRIDPANSCEGKHQRNTSVAAEDIVRAEETNPLPLLASLLIYADMEKFL